MSDLHEFGEADVAARLPTACPYSLDQILGNFWPERCAADADGLAENR